MIQTKLIVEAYEHTANGNLESILEQWDELDGQIRSMYADDLVALSYEAGEAAQEAKRLGCLEWITRLISSQTEIVRVLAKYPSIKLRINLF